MAPKLVIFDWDGVIIHNSMEVLVSAIVDIMIKDRPDIDKNEVINDFILGRSNNKQELIRDKYDLKITEDMLKKSENMYAECLPLMQPTKDVEKLFAALGKNKIVVASNSKAEFILQLVKKHQFEDFFNQENVFSARDEGCLKPDPQIFKLAVEKFSVKPEEALIVEDEQNNISTAKLAGFKTFAYIGAEHLKNRQEGVIRAMYEAGADYISNDLLDILEVMEIEK